MALPVVAADTDADVASAVSRARAAVAEEVAARRRLLDRIATGERTPAAALTSAATEDDVAACRVLVLLEAAPGASKVATRRLLAELGIDELATVAQAGPEAVARLIERLEAGS